mmetsp:Transcript_2278/g.5922  ORF Transcript_2278/g.5922 Transcript_2278/m.5922 type:complete len:237 (-) Transcript_2278:856-1566(-)
MIVGDQSLPNVAGEQRRDDHVRLGGILDELFISPVDENIVDEKDDGDEDESAADDDGEDLGDVLVVRSLKFVGRVYVHAVLAVTRRGRIIGMVMKREVDDAFILVEFRVMKISRALEDGIATVDHVRVRLVAVVADDGNDPLDVVGQQIDQSSVPSCSAAQHCHDFGIVVADDFVDGLKEETMRVLRARVGELGMQRLVLLLRERNSGRDVLAHIGDNGLILQREERLGHGLVVWN